MATAAITEFGQRVFDWLLADDALIDFGPDKGAPDNRLRISQRALGVIGTGFLIVLPFLAFIGGVDLVASPTAASMRKSTRSLLITAVVAIALGAAVYMETCA